MNFFRHALLCVWPCLAVSSFAATVPEDLRLNHIQVKGTHNSYHKQPAIVFDASHRYTHLPISEQLGTAGIRAFELDVHRPTVGSDLRVYHIAVIDARTTCSKFKDCLRDMKTWSDRNPRHVPIFVWIEVKDDAGGWKFENFSRVDSEIRSILGDRLITPEQVQGDFPDLQTAIAAKGWPRVEDVRGRFLFILDSDARNAQLYLNDGGLKGRMMFMRANPPEAEQTWAVVTKAGPGDFQNFAVTQGWLVADNVCNAGDQAADCRARSNASKQGGAHMLMDDFTGPSPAQSLDGYYIQLDEHPSAQCNRLTAPIDCLSSSLDAF